MKTDYWWPTAFSCWGEEEQAAIQRVVESGRFTQGAEVEAFEHEFAAWHGRKHGIMVNSGSSANLVAVAAVREELPGDRRFDAIVPAIAWSTTYAPLVQRGFHLEIADVDDTWNAPVPEQLRTTMYKPEVMVACSILGNPAYLTEWQKIAQRYQCRLIEDNCESLGAVAADGTRCGCAGDLATFSFFYSHQISAIEGGMILTDDQGLADKCRMLRAHGWTRDIRPPADFSQEYNFEVMGFNVRGLEMHAAIAREQLKKLPTFIEHRQHNHGLFMEAARDEGLPITFPPPHGQQSPFGIPFCCESPTARSRVVRALRAEGIDCRLPTGGSFTKHKYGLRWAFHQTPKADRIDACGLFIGNPPWPFDEKIDIAIRVIGNALAQKEAAE